MASSVVSRLGSSTCLQGGRRRCPPCCAMNDEPDQRQSRSGGRGRQRSRRPREDKPELKHFLPLPKPAHLVFIKPTVAVVADWAPRNSVGLKMTASDQPLERFVIEYYSRSL